MVVKEEKKEACKKVQIRRDAVTGHSNVSLIFSPPPRTIANPLLAIGVPPVTSRPISPLMSTDDSDSSPNTTLHDQVISQNLDHIDFHRLSVERILDSPYRVVFELLRQLDLETDKDLIIEMLLHFSLVIKGLPDCPEEDLPLAVYFFIEDTFGIQSKLVVCTKIRQYDGKMNVGVVFDTIRMKYDILRKDELLEGTEVRIVNNTTPRYGREFRLFPTFP